MTLKVSEGKTSKNVSKSSEDGQYSSSGTVFCNVLLLGCSVVILVSMSVDVTVLHWGLIMHSVNSLV